MQNPLSTFNFNTSTIRVVTLDGASWFVARDVYLVLFGRTTGINSGSTLGPDEKRLIMKVSAPVALRPLED